jgi:hypothetical protein
MTAVIGASRKLGRTAASSDVGPTAKVGRVIVGGGRPRDRQGNIHIIWRGRRLRPRRTVGQSCAMPDRSFPAVDNLIRRAQRIAAGRPDPARILAQTISMACPGGADPYAVLGLLIEGTVQTLVEHIPKERQAEVAMTLKEMLEERMKASGVPDSDD